MFGRAVGACRELVVGATSVAELVLLSPTRPIQIAKAAYEHDRDVGGGLLAGAIAFRLFVWAVAFGVVAVGGLGIAASQSSSTEEGLSGFGATSFIFDSIDDVAQSAGHTRWFILALGLYLLFSASRSTLRALWTSSSIVWRLPISRPPAISSLLALNLVLVSLFAVNGVSGFLRELTPGPGIGIRVLAAAVQLGILLLGLRWLPRAPVPLRSILPGAVVVAVGGQVMNVVSTVYLPSRIESASTTTGTLGTAVVLLAWVYLYARLLVFGSVLNATLRHEHSLAEGTADAEDPALVAASLITGAYERRPDPPAGAESAGDGPASVE